MRSSRGGWLACSSLSDNRLPSALAYRYGVSHHRRGIRRLFGRTQDLIGRVARELVESRARLEMNVHDRPQIGVSHESHHIRHRSTIPFLLPFHLQRNFKAIARDDVDILDSISLPNTF